MPIRGDGACYTRRQVASEREEAIKFDYHALPLAPALAAIMVVGANTVPLLERLHKAPCSRAGRHSETGRDRAEDRLCIYAEHLELHIAQSASNLWT